MLAVNMNSLLVLGSCRAHRPFARPIPEQIKPETNLPENLRIIFPRLGYLHASSEAAQAVRFLENPAAIPAGLREYVFRIEPRRETPLNEFDVCLEETMKSGIERMSADMHFFAQCRNPDFIFVEISTLRVNWHPSTGIFFHLNPNAKRSAGYGQYQPKGYFGTFHPEMGVINKEETFEEVVDNLIAIKAKASRELLVCGHLVSSKSPHPGRKKQNMIIKEACRLANACYIETEIFVDKYGFRDRPSGIDVHHLSLEGEVAFGKHIVKVALEAPPPTASS